MNWKQAIGTILLGNLIVLIPMLLKRARRHALRNPLPRSSARPSESAAPMSQPCCALS